MVATARAGDLAESIVGFGNLTFFLHPAGGSVAGDGRRNLRSPGLRADDGAGCAAGFSSAPAQRVLAIHRAKKTTLESTRSEGVSTPENARRGCEIMFRRPACIRPTRGRFDCRASFGAGSQRLTNGFVHLAIHLLRALHAVDGMTEIDHFLSLRSYANPRRSPPRFRWCARPENPGLVPDFSALRRSSSFSCCYLKLSVVRFDESSRLRSWCGMPGFSPLCSRRQSFSCFFQTTALQPDRCPHFGILAIHCAHC